MILKKIFDFYLDASVHVALAVVSIYLLNTQLLNIPVNVAYAFFLGSSTIVCYNFMKYGVEAEKYLIVKNTYQRYIQFFSFVLFAVTCYTFLKLPQFLYAPILFLSLLSALYGIPFLPSAKNLRNLGGLKIFLVALVWVGFTVWVPQLENSLPLNGQMVILMLMLFLLVLILFVPFEIRDLQYDAPELKTLPQRFGVGNTKIAGYALCSLLFILSFFIGQGLIDVLFWSVTTLLLVMAVWATKESQTPYFASFWVEGIPILIDLMYYGIRWLES